MQEYARFQVNEHADGSDRMGYLARLVGEVAAAFQVFDTVRITVEYEEEGQ